MLLYRWVTLQYSLLPGNTNVAVVVYQLNQDRIAVAVGCIPMNPIASSHSRVSFQFLEIQVTPLTHAFENTSSIRFGALVVLVSFRLEDQHRRTVAGTRALKKQQENKTLTFSVCPGTHHVYLGTNILQRYGHYTPIYNQGPNLHWQHELTGSCATQNRTTSYPTESIRTPPQSRATRRFSRQAQPFDFSTESAPKAVF